MLNLNLNHHPMYHFDQRSRWRREEAQPLRRWRVEFETQQAGGTTYSELRDGTKFRRKLLNRMDDGTAIVTATPATTSTYNRSCRDKKPNSPECKAQVKPVTVANNRGISSSCNCACGDSIRQRRAFDVMVAPRPSDAVVDET